MVVLVIQVTQVAGGTGRYVVGYLLRGERGANVVRPVHRERGRHRPALYILCRRKFKERIINRCRESRRESRLQVFEADVRRWLLRDQITERYGALDPRAGVARLVQAGSG